MYLKTSHNYLSLKMKYKQKLEQEFPALGPRKVEDDGFGHMIEEEVEEFGDDQDPNAEEQTPDDSTDNTLKIDPNDFVYDETTDTVKPLNVNAFEELVEKHPSVHKLRRGDKRDEKIAGLKSKVLQTLKVTERKKRSLSCDSIKSGCSGWGVDEVNLDSKERDSSTDSRGKVRRRSEDEIHSKAAKKPHHQRKTILQPPKIVISKK